MKFRHWRICQIIIEDNRKDNAAVSHLQTGREGGTKCTFNRYIRRLRLQEIGYENQLIVNSLLVQIVRSLRVSLTVNRSSWTVHR